MLNSKMLGLLAKNSVAVAETKQLFCSASTKAYSMINADNENNWLPPA